MARIAAQSIVFCQFDPKRVVAELRPDIKCYRPFFAKLMDEMAVRREIEIIMSRTERDATKFLKLMWDWLEAEPPSTQPGVTFIDKSLTERQLTAARILAKGYISEKKDAQQPAKPIVIEGLSEGMTNLVGPPLPSKDRKVN